MQVHSGASASAAKQLGQLASVENTSALEREVLTSIEFTSQKNTSLRPNKNSVAAHTH